MKHFDKKSKLLLLETRKNNWSKNRYLSWIVTVGAYFLVVIRYEISSILILYLNIRSSCSNCRSQVDFARVKKRERSQFNSKRQKVSTMWIHWISKCKWHLLEFDGIVKKATSPASFCQYTVCSVNDWKNGNTHNKKKLPRYLINKFIGYSSIALNERKTRSSVWIEWARARW